jgi:hypothetical protein
MNKKISLIMALAIATILTAYISAPNMSNQAFAQGSGMQIFVKEFSRNIETNLQAGKVLAGEGAQAGKVLAEVEMPVGKVLPGHETQVGEGLEFAWVIKGQGHPGLGCSGKRGPPGC